MNGWDSLRGIAPLSLCDWPGHVCAVLFFGGCNLRCPTCHNSTIAWRPQSMPALSRKYVMDDLSNRWEWLDGITITGGEASIVPGIETVLVEFKNLELPVKLDTNGVRPDRVRTLLERNLVECFAVDVKGPWDKYPELTGNTQTSEEARKHLQAIFDMAREHPDRFYFRCTQVPCLTDEDVETVRSYLPQGFDLTVQSYIEPSEDGLVEEFSGEPEEESLGLSDTSSSRNLLPTTHHA